MAKIGTAHVEIKPVLNEAALEALCKTVEDAITEAVSDGLRGRAPAMPSLVEINTEKHSVLIDGHRFPWLLAEEGPHIEKRDLYDVVWLPVLVPRDVNRTFAKP